MDLLEHTCSQCGYTHIGPGGLGFTANNTGVHTVWCAQCAELQNVRLDRRWASDYLKIEKMPDGPEKHQAIIDHLAVLPIRCKRERWHNVMLWVSGGRYIMGSRAFIAVCPRCRGQMTEGPWVACIDYSD